MSRKAVSIGRRIIFPLLSFSALMSNSTTRPSSGEPLPLSRAFRTPRQYGQTLRKRIKAQLGKGPGQRRTTLALLTLAGLAGLFLLWWLYLIIATPSVGELRKARYAQATVVLTDDGEELARYSIKNRKWVPLDSISTYVTEALIATEDRRFREHAGIDLKRTAGAIFQTATGDVQGGSTITMQLARNAFPAFQDDFILTRKFKEWLTAIHIEDLYKKDEVLEMYLNTVPFLYNAFGIEAGAQTYFGKPAFELNEIEAATLVAMLKGPAYYNPRQHPDRAYKRRNVVLDQMRKAGYLDEDRYDLLRQKKMALDFSRISYGSKRAPHFTEHLRQRLQEWAEEEGYNLYTSGLRIHTPLDSRMQEAAETAVAEMGKRLQSVAEKEWGGASFPVFWNQNTDLLDRFVRQSARFKRLTVSGGASADSALSHLKSNAGFIDSLKRQQQRLEASFVALDPSNGHVKAWVGGRGFETSEYDHVSQARRQPGSTFKPFVYATALKAGFSPNDRVRDEVRTYRRAGAPAWSPENFGSASGRMVRVSEGLAQSKNTITAHLMMEVGPEAVAELAHQMGIVSELNAVPSLALGTSPVSLLELAGAYTSIADQGMHHEPVSIIRIEDRSGQVIGRFDDRERRGLDASIAYTLLDMMRGVVDGGTGQRIRSSYGAVGDLAGKTGTTQKGADGWFMLMHPELVMGSWVGFSTSALHFRSQYWGQGSHTALPIVGRFYQQVDLSEDASFEPPPGYKGPAQSTRRRSGEEDSGESLSVADSLTRAARGDSSDVDSTQDASTTPDALDVDSLRRPEAHADSLNQQEEESQEQQADTTRPGESEPPSPRDTSETSTSEDQAGEESEAPKPDTTTTPAS